MLEVRGLCVIVAIVLVTFGSTFAHPKPEAEIPSCSFLEVYRNDGWGVPGINGAEPKEKRAKLANSAGVFVTVLRPKESRTILTEIWCSREQKGRIQIEDRPITIIHLWRFDFDGRVFAYGVSYGNEAIQKGGRVPLGSVSAAIFYDVDGSGLFKARRGANYPFTPDFIPAWVGTEKR